LTSVFYGLGKPMICKNLEIGIRVSY